MSKNAMTGAVTLCGVGLCMIGGALLMQSGGQAHAAGGVMPAAAAVASAVNAQAGPTVVWMGVSAVVPQQSCYHRLWSDGRLERRVVQFTFTGSVGQLAGALCGTYVELGVCSDTGWVEVTPPPGGNAVTCRTDINGDGLVGSSDLSLLLNDWGQEGRCEPTYPCLDLGNLAGGVAFK